MTFKQVWTAISQTQLRHQDLISTAITLTVDLPSSFSPLEGPSYSARRQSLKVQSQIGECVQSQIVALIKKSSTNLNLAYLLRNCLQVLIILNDLPWNTSQGWGYRLKVPKCVVWSMDFFPILRPTTQGICYKLEAMANGCWRTVNISDLFYSCLKLSPQSSLILSSPQLLKCGC